jgi:hypothetical protein
VPIIDLHYQTTEAALSLLDELWPSLLACGHQYAIIITGRGRHSGEGGPRIPARVADWLHNKGYRGNKMRRAGDGAKVLVDLLWRSAPANNPALAEKMKRWGSSFRKKTSRIHKEKKIAELIWAQQLV